MLREWRERRRRTQLDLALDARISARHLSFVETGRSNPGADIILRIAEQLEVPFRERNELLLAAGHAPAFPERPLHDPEMAATRSTLESILTRHEPYPAMALDRRWNLIAANQPMSLLGAMIDADLLVPPVNLMRAGLHPRGLARWIINLGQVRAYFIERLQRQVTLTADPHLAALLDEVSGYPCPEPQHDEPDASARPAHGPIRIRTPDGDDLAFFGLFATFDAPFDVTTSELAIELAYPADPRTAELLTTFARGRRD
jgi:transcriptional regulator with XRE-family HTH domain